MPKPTDTRDGWHIRRLPASRWRWEFWHDQQRLFRSHQSWTSKAAVHCEIDLLRVQIANGDLILGVEQNADGKYVGTITRRDGAETIQDVDVHRN